MNDEEKAQAARNELAAILRHARSTGDAEERRLIWSVVREAARCVSWRYGTIHSSR
jgi:hypothetical protein